MEKTYWLGRKRASLKMASDATNSKARLIHFDLAGRYSVKANEADVQSGEPIAAPAPRSDLPDTKPVSE